MKNKKFINQLIAQLKKLEVGDVTTGEIGNNEGSWVALNLDGKMLEIGFDKDGNMDMAGLYDEDGSEKVWAAFRPQPVKELKTPPKYATYTIQCQFPIGTRNIIC